MATKMKVKVTLDEEMLGMSPADPEIYASYIGSNAPDAPSLQEEIASLGENEVMEGKRTIFPRDENGRPFVWDYQIKGFFKDSCGMLSRLTKKDGGKKKPQNESGKLTAYKKVIDGLIFVEPRKIPLVFDGEMGDCQRPLRAQTAQGERIALASSDTVPAGTTMEFTVTCLDDDHMDAVREWLDYGKLRGFGQWRNSGKGKFSWEEVK